MRNAGMEEAQAGIKIAGRNINNLRYADDTTLMAESKEELKSLLMKVKEESDKVAQDNKLPRGHNEPGNPLKEMYSFYKYLLSSYYVSFLLKYHLQCIISVNPPNNPVLFYCFIIIPI